MVTVKPKDMKEVKAVELVEEFIELELGLYSRWVDSSQGTLYTRSNVYRFKKSQAEELLRRADNGKPIWIRHYPSKKTKVVEVGPEVVDMSTATFKKPEKGIELATREEFEELGLLDDDGIDV